MSGIRSERLIDEDGNVILTGGLKCAETNRQRYGKDWYSKIGAIGGRKGTADGVIKGFAANPTLAREAGAKAGKISKIGYKYLGTEGGKNKYLDKDTGKVVEFPVCCVK